MDRNLEIIKNRIKNSNNFYIKIFRKIFPRKSKLIRTNDSYTVTQNSIKDKPCYTDEEKEKFKKQKDIDFFNMISNFVTTIKDKNPTFDLNNFYNKVDDLIYLYIPSLFRIYNGLYAPNFNLICTFNPTKEKSMTDYHELFHAISSKDSFSSGFHKSVLSSDYDTAIFGKKIVIGEFINEGYTELLNIRYFNSQYGRSYAENVFFMNKLEHIIGKDKMENLYVNSDLNGLFNEINKYLSKEDAIQVISTKYLSQKSLLYLEKMSLNKSKLEHKNVDSEFIKSIKNVSSYLDKNTKKIDLFGKTIVYTPSRKMPLRENLSDNESKTPNVQNSNIQNKPISRVRTKGFIEITSLITIIVFISMIIFLVL